MARKVLVSWSGGKDCAWALKVLRDDPAFEVAGLMTTVNLESGRVSMHGIRPELLRRQARSLGLPLRTIGIPDPCPNEHYDAIMRRVVADALEEGIECVAFGDLFLEDIRAYRESRLEGTGLAPVFPLWNMPTGGLAREMIDAGLRAFITCVDGSRLDPTFAGRLYDATFLTDLPGGVDHCGERGEFHTFVADGPGFSAPVACRPGPITERNGFIHVDLMPEAGMEIEGV